VKSTLLSILMPYAMTIPNMATIAPPSTGAGMIVVIAPISRKLYFTTYSRNVGLIQLSGVKNNHIIYLTGFFLVILGLVLLNSFQLLDHNKE
jgi:xanthine/uracil permease